jgi:BolA protein
MAQGMVEEQIRDRLTPLEPESLELLDESGLHVGHPGATGGGHYRLTVVSPLFAGQTRVARHRMVYEALQPLMQQHIHALALVTRAPGES